MSLPISQIINKKDESSEPQLKKSRHEEYKKEKELEEARKAGTVPALVDEDGRDINPHIPQYISSVPFFYNTNQPTLRHQRQLDHKPENVPLDLPFKRGIKIQTATKYRPGACENCGAMTHKRKDCLERPRKIGAKFTNKNIAPDEVILPQVNHTFDSKRDRWNGYEPGMYKEVIDEFNKVEEAKAKLNSKTSTAKSKDDVSVSDSDDDDDDDDDYVPGSNVKSEKAGIVKNLRLREDKAKYLLNLDPNSAYYDPKTRSMREDPVPGGSQEFKGENFVRSTDYAPDLNKAQVFAWQAAEKGVDVHLQALPTKTEIIRKEFEVKKQQYDEKINDYIARKYGNPEKFAKPASQLEMTQSEQFVQYSRKGDVVECRQGIASSSTDPEDRDVDDDERDKDTHEYA